jgi:hypothetical protein
MSTVLWLWQDSYKNARKNLRTLTLESHHSVLSPLPARPELRLW